MELGFHLSDKSDEVREEAMKECRGWAERVKGMTKRILYWWSTLGKRLLDMEC